MDFALIVSAFIAGIITFLAPCTLPLVPGYLGFISGVKESDAHARNSDAAHAARRTILKNALLFIFGFSTVFILFGALAGLLGAALAPYRTWFARIGGGVVILFGFMMLRFIRIKPLEGEKRLRIAKWIPIGTPTGSFLIGGTFAIGWTPCVGPILASILFLATSSATISSAVLLLAVFSFGLALPFLLVAFLYARALEFITRAEKILRGVEIVGGLLLIVLGILLATGNFGLTISYSYEFFRNLGLPGYESFFLDRL